ncbi:hypothetical protein SDJN02_10482, partial [Cucurbita argyrosperma subsp. argyrosperma]
MNCSPYITYAYASSFVVCLSLARYNIYLFIHFLCCYFIMIPHNLTSECKSSSELAEIDLCLPNAIHTNLESLNIAIDMVDLDCCTTSVMKVHLITIFYFNMNAVRILIYSQVDCYSTEEIDLRS